MLSATLGPDVHSTSNINGIRSVKIMFLRNRARPMSRADSLPSYVSRLSRQCGILNISQPYRPPRSVTGIALLYGDGVCFL
jgi:hypothetical protein